MHNVYRLLFPNYSEKETLMDQVNEGFGFKL